MQWANEHHKFRLSSLPIILCIAFSSFHGQANGVEKSDIPSTMDVKSEEEAFLVRRIAEFWKDQDYVLVKRQIHNFLEVYPKSAINDQLRGILGDLYLQEKQYAEGLAAYSEISDPYIEEKVIVNRLQCYYELNDYVALAHEGKAYLHISSSRIGDRQDELHFLVAESLFRQALETDDSSLKNDLASQSRPLYEAIKESTFGKHAKLALGEVYNILGDHETASTYYLEVANAYPEQSEELLSQAALSQSEYDPQLAIHTFSQIVDMKGDKATEAATNRLILFFQQDEYDNVIKHYPALSVAVSSEKKPTIDYVVGRSYFAMHDYKNASDFLHDYATSQTGPTPHLKNALLMQLNCTQQNGDDALCDKTIAHFKEHFMADPELNQALFIHAMMLKGRGDLPLAEEELAYIMGNHFEDTESLYLEYGLVCHENGKWVTSYNSLKNYIAAHPSGEHKNVAWKYFLSSSLNRIKMMEEDDSYTKTQFYDDLALVLNEQSLAMEVLSAEEEKDCRLLSSKTAYELKRFAVAASQIEAYLEDYSTDPNLGEAHLILGICHQNLDSDPALFYTNVEKALALNPELTDQSSLHLQLYNAYLAKIELMSTTTPEQNIVPGAKGTLFDSAAEHLYKAVKLDNNQVKEENKLWLANHYYLKMKSDSQNTLNEDHIARSFELYSPMLLGSSGELVTLSEENLFLEAEVLKYIEILALKEDHSQRMVLLKSLAEQQTHNHSFEWEYQMQTLLELAQSYEVLKDSESALETYDFILNSSKGSRTYINDFATLHSSRLKFDRLDTELRNPNNESILTMLNHLKDLQIQKSAPSEPLHLEAAIEYAHIRAHICAEGEKEERYLFFLGRLKEDFFSDQDLMVREYHAKLNQDVQKKELFDAYMAYVDGEVLRTQAALEHKNNALESAKLLKEKALGKLAEVKSSPALTPYLSDKVHQSIQSIDLM